MKKATLKPCPFCGSEAFAVKTNPKQFCVKCSSCSCRTPGMMLQEARNVWNNRRFAEIQKSSEENLTFGIRLKRIRMKNQINIKRLAEQINSSYKIIRAVEAGEALPDCEMIVNLARAFDCSTDYLLGNQVKP